MWSYYGRKSKVVKYYPPPIYDTIIEPFAGTASYSLHNGNWRKKVILIEKYDIVVAIWKYLQRSLPSDILELPEMKSGENTDDYSFSCQEQKWLMGFLVQGGVNAPRKTVSSVGGFGRMIPTMKKQIANDIHKIHHWDISLGDYHDAHNIEATWFIDPPYQFGGEYYRYGNRDIDYAELAQWCMSRKGQIIVCENTKANWLPFVPLASMRGNLHKTTEAIWTNINPQLTMF